MKKILSKFDLFPAPAILRAEGEGEVMNLCGSIFSILVFGFFTYVFIAGIASTVRLQRITTNEITEIAGEQNRTVGNITMAVGLQWMNLLQLRHIFQLKAFLVDQNMNFTPISVFPCSREMWSDLDDTKYSVLKIQNSMCIQRQGVQIYGENGSPNLQMLYFNLGLCDPLSSPVPCANNTEINTFFASSMIWSRFLGCSVIILDVGFNPTNQVPITHTIYEKTLWLLFNNEQQIVMQLFLGTYQINTDTNFLPMEAIETQKGYFVSEAIASTIINSKSLPYMVQCFVFISPINKVVTRAYGKLDEVLSYVGGLFGIIISFFAFFLMSFNQYKYQLRVSEGAFSFRQAHLARESSFHFGKYLKYVIFDWTKTLFCYQINWEDCKAIQNARQQAIEQIDVKHLLKRISHLQKIINYIISKQDEVIFYLTQANSIDEVRRRRSITQYCEKFVEQDKFMTISTFQQASALLHFAESRLLVKSQQSIVYPEDGNKVFNFQNNQAEQSIPLQKKSSSLELMQEYVLKYIQKFDINEKSFQLTDQQMRLQQQISNAFFSLQQSKRLKMIRKIPLGILYRLNKYVLGNKQKFETHETKSNEHQFSKLNNSMEFKRKKNENKNKVINLDYILN